MADSKDALTYHDFLRQFEKGERKPFYVFQGQETFLIEEALERVKEALIRPEAADFNLHKFSAKETSISQVVDLAQTLPFLSQSRLIILADIDELNADAQKRLLAYLTDPNPMTCLLMTAEKLDSRTKLAQHLKHQAAIVQFWKLFDRDIPKWIVSRAKQHGYLITPPTAAYLAELVGNDLRQLDNELKKIGAYAQHKEITMETVQRVVGDIRERDIFELVDAVGAGKLADALRSLNQLLIEGEEPLKILAMLTRQFRLLWKMKAALVENKSLSAKQMAGALGIPPRSAEQLQQQVQRFSQVQLKQGLKRLYDVDRALKSSTNAPKMLLEDVMLDLCVPSKV